MRVHARMVDVYVVFGGVPRDPRRFLAHWLVVTLALGATAWILPGVHVDSIAALLVGSLVLGFMNAVVRPALALLTLPLTILTLGLSYLVVNAAAFGLAAWVVPGFVVSGFWWAVLGALLVSLLSALMGGFDKKKAPKRTRE